MKFEIEGIRTTNSSERLQKLLSNLPDGKLLTVSKVANKLGLHTRTIRDQINQLPEQYYYRLNTFYLLGNPRTVKQYMEYCEREFD